MKQTEREARIAHFLGVPLDTWLLVQDHAVAFGGVEQLLKSALDFRINALEAELAALKKERSTLK